MTAESISVVVSECDHWLLTAEPIAIAMSRCDLDVVIAELWYMDVSLVL